MIVSLNSILCKAYIYLFSNQIKWYGVLALAVSYEIILENLNSGPDCWFIRG